MPCNRFTWAVAKQHVGACKPKSKNSEHACKRRCAPCKSHLQATSWVHMVVPCFYHVNRNQSWMRHVKHIEAITRRHVKRSAIALRHVSTSVPTCKRDAKNTEIQSPQRCEGFRLRLSLQLQSLQASLKALSVIPGARRCVPPKPPSLRLRLSLQLQSLLASSKALSVIRPPPWSGLVPKIRRLPGASP